MQQLNQKLGALALGVALAALAQSQAAGLVNVDIYSGFADAGGGAPYSGLVGSFTSPDIMFATDTGYNWHPFSMGSFGADITGCIDVPADGAYTFTLDSDDGSILLIGGSPIIDNGGGHGPTVVSGTATLSAGKHPFEVQFFEDFGGPSGVDLTLPAGVSYTSCPDGGSSMALLGGAMLLIGSLSRKLRA